MDAGLLRFLGLHRLQPIHVVLVRQYSGRDAILPRPEHRIVVAVKHAPGHRAFLWPLRDSVAPGNQETTKPTLYRRRMDTVYAGARYVYTCAAVTPRHRRAPQRLGFPLPDRHRLQPRFPLSAVDWVDFHFSGA